MQTQTIPLQDITKIFENQKATALEWGKSSAAERIKRLNKLALYLKDQSNQDRLFDALHKDLRKHKLEALTSEVVVVLNAINDIKKNLKYWMAPKKVDTPMALQGASSYIHYETKGRALIIAPWNYPFQLSVNPLLYAIAAGCTAIVKPSEFSEHTARFLKEMIEDLFTPDEVKVVEGGVEVSQELLSLPFDHMYFTGSPAVGKIVMRAAAEHLSSITLELGGKSPVIVDDTAKLSMAANRIAWGKCFNAGQTCIAPDYAIVHKSKCPSFIKQLISSIEKKYKIGGKEIQESPDFGRIINQKHFDRITHLIQDAINKGAKLEYGGHADKSEKYIGPTVLSQVTEDMDIMKEEIFGPVLPILTYQNKEEVPDIIRKRPKPLAFYVFSSDQKNINYFINNSSAGGTVINDLLLHFANHHLPFGGVNHSGIGKSHGSYGFLAFSNERGIMHQHLGATELLHPPYNKSSFQLVNVMKKMG